MASEPMPIALVAFRMPSEPCFTGRGKSAGLLPGALRAASNENMDRAAGPAYIMQIVGLGGHCLSVLHAAMWLQ